MQAEKKREKAREGEQESTNARHEELGERMDQSEGQERAPKQDRIRALREELRLKLQLVRMEVLDRRDNITDRIDGLSHTLIDVARDLDEKISNTGLQFHLGLMETGQKWERLKHRAADMFDALKKEDVLGHKILDEVILKTSLAKMETRDILGRSRDELNKTWQHVSHQSMVALRKMNEGIGDLFHRLS